MERKDKEEVRSVESGTVECTCEEVGHETLGDARNVEVELPAALKELLECLNGSLSPGFSPVQEIPDLRGNEYGDYFRPGGGKRKLVRLKVLHALGNCRTLRKFSSYSIREWNLSMEEWKALLVPLRTAPLEEIQIHPLGSAEPEALIGPLWRDVFAQAENLNFLLLRWLTVELAKQVVLGLRANSHKNLKELHILNTWTKWTKDIGVVHVAEIISSAPKLESLLLRELREVDAGEIEALANALRHSRCLREIRICNTCLVDVLGQEIGDVLVDVYSESPSNPVLECLSFEGKVGVTAEQLAHLIRGNICTIEIGNYPLGVLHHLMLDEWKSIGRSLLHATVLKSFLVHLSINKWPQVDLTSLDLHLVELWKASNKSPLLRIDFHIIFYSLQEEISKFLHKTLNDNYLKVIHVRFEKEGLNHFTSVVDSLASNTSVECVEIDFEVGLKDQTEKWRYFFDRLRENSFIRKLTLYSTYHERKLHEDNFRDLMDLLEVNHTLEEIDVSRTSWMDDGKRVLIEEALRRNRRRAGYFSVFPSASLSFAAEFSCVDYPMQEKKPNSKLQ